ncbi:MAG: type II toxin-antitoxin system VapC family toxin [Clostridia bacterium]|nr:type II toxin-antitoxin system VapC family toxin [Clostridia bacterium]
MIVLDTDIFIDYFRGLTQAGEYLRSLSLSENDCRCTDITVMELFRGAEGKRDLQRIKKFLRENGFASLPVTSPASRLAVELLEQYGLSHGLGIPDALIAGVVLSVGAKLITGNSRHFDFIPGLSVARPPYRSFSNV